MPVHDDWDEVTDVTERCRAYWVLTEVPKPAADDMTAELEGHLRERIAAGAPIDRVVGPDLREFAEAWATERRASPPRGVRLLRALNGPVTTVATYAVVAHAVEWVVGRDPSVLLMRPSDFVWLAALLAATVVLAQAAHVSGLIIARRERPLLLTSLALFVLPIALPVFARTVGAFGMVLVAWPWWASLLLAIAGGLSLVGAKPAPGLPTA